jgi:hypothetical protein
VVLTDGPVQPWLFTLAFYFSLTAESPQKQWKRKDKET